MAQGQSLEGAAPIRGVGLGLRPAHYAVILSERPPVPWFEVLIDNYFSPSPELEQLERVRRDYPVTFHGVGMSLGSSDPIDWDYLRRLKGLIRWFEPQHVSDHLCWTSVNGHYLHELMPLPYVDAAVRHVSERIERVQDFLGERILVENVSTYLEYQASELTEWEFLNRIAEACDCDVLLDVNNIFVSASNHRFDPITYLESIPIERVREIHLAGYEDQGTHLLDTHGEAVHEPVWRLYRRAIERLGPVPTLIERDNNIPPFEDLHAEALQAQHIMDTACRHAA